MGKHGLFVVMGGVVVVAFVLLGLLYNLLSTTMAPEDEYTYSDFEHFDALEDADAIDDDYFMVFYYDPNGEGSEMLKHDVFNFTAEYEASFTIYYLEGPTAQASSVSETPALLIYSDGMLSAIRSGEAGIYSVMDDAADGLIP